MVKKITAPHSYNPGKGRPQEYLAYLNEREMAYLRSINGNNMERGPRGLPSFPPDDAVGSSSKAGNKGPGGPSGPNSGPSTGGGGKGPGGPSGPNSGPSGGGNLGGGGKGGGPSGSPSRGPGGPSGPNSGPSQGGGGKSPTSSPSSPMGGQGSSFSSPQRASSYNADRSAQQRAQVNDTRGALTKSPSVRNDLSAGGIRTLNVGPIGTPVNVGPRVSPTQNRASVVGGWGAQPFSSAIPKAPSFASPMTAPPGYRPKDPGQIQRSLYGASKQIYDKVPTGKQFGVLGSGYDERIAPEPSSSTSISSQFPSYKYDSPLTPGMTPDDMARRGALMDRYEREIRDIMRGDPTSTGDPLKAGGVPTVGGVPGKTRSIGGGPTSPTYSGGTFNQENEIQQAAVDRAISAAIAARELAPEQRPSVTRTGSPIDAGGISTLSSRTVPGGFISSAEAGSLPQKENPLSGAGYGTFNVPKSAQIDAQLAGIERDLNAPSLDEEEKILEVENFPDRPTYTDGTYFSPENPPSTDMYNRSRIGSRIGVGLGGIGARAGRTSYTPGEYEAYRNEGSVPDATNMSTEEMVQALRPSGKTRSAAEAWENTPYGEPGAPARQRGPVEKFLQEKFPHWGVRGVAKGYGYVEDRRIEGMTPDERIAEMDKRAQMNRDRFKGADGRDDGIGSGGKAEPIPYTPQNREPPKVDPSKKEDGPRPAIYYKWDIGIGIPSPGDSDYTLYLKYLQEKEAAKAAVS